MISSTRKSENCRIQQNALVYTPKSRCSSGVERFLGKEEVMGSIPIIGSYILIK